MENNFLNPQNPYIKPQTTGEEQGFSPVGVPQTVLSEEEKEIKTLKSKMTGIGLVLIVMFVLMQLWVFPFMIVPQLLGVPYESLKALLDNEYFTLPLHVVLSSLCFTVPFIVLTRVRKTTVSETVPLGRAKKGTALPFFMFGMSVCALSNIFSSYSHNALNSFLSLFGLKYELTQTDGEKGILIFILAFLSTAVVPALVEEFGCRGVMFGLLKEHSEGAAIIVTAVIFGVIHGNFVQIPFAFMVGLVLAVIRLKTGTLWVAIAVHFCNNLVSVIFEYVLYPLPDMLQNAIYYIYLLTCMLLGVLGVVLIAKNSPETFSLNLNKNGISEKKIVTVSLTRPLIIIILAVYLLLALTFITA